MLGLTITPVGMGLGRFPEGCKPIEFCVIERAEAAQCSLFPTTH